MSLPLVSVLIPCYNHQDYIEECINSVLDQDYENLSIIITDDFSLDNSRSILLTKYNNNPKIKLILNDKNRGLNLSMKHMLEISDGEFIAQFSGDDYWSDKSKITKQINWFDSNREASICFTGVQKINKYGHFENINNAFDDIINEHNIFKKTYILGESYSSFLIRKKFIPLDPFPEKLGVFADWYNICRVALNGKVGGIKDFTTVYRKHDNSLSALNSEIMIYDHLEVCFLLKQSLDEALSKDLFDMINFLIFNKYESINAENENKIDWLSKQRGLLTAELDSIKSKKIYRMLKHLNIL